MDIHRVVGRWVEVKREADEFVPRMKEAVTLS